MDRFSPPQPQRFDPITGLWASPEGLLHDPARADVQGQPVELVGPIPPELIDDEPADAETDGTRVMSRSQRLRWLLLAVATGWVALITLAGSVGDCLDADGCALTGPTPMVWALAAVCIGLAAYAIARTVSGFDRTGDN